MEIHQVPPEVKVSYLPISTEPVPLKVDSAGVIRVGGTRVTLDTVVAAFSEGATAEEIVEQYPSLDSAGVYAVVCYCLRRRSEVEDCIHRRGELAEKVREENETRFDPYGVRERLLARSSGNGRK